MDLIKEVAIKLGVENEKGKVMYRLLLESSLSVWCSVETFCQGRFP